jgi:hypothetical protein
MFNQITEDYEHEMNLLKKNHKHEMDELQKNHNHEINKYKKDIYDLKTESKKKDVQKYMYSISYDVVWLLILISLLYASILNNYQSVVISCSLMIVVVLVFITLDIRIYNAVSITYKKHLENPIMCNEPEEQGELSNKSDEQYQISLV